MWWYILAGIAAIVFVAFVWGILHLRNSQRVAAEAVRKVRIEDVEPLRLECERVFEEAFGESLSLERYEESAKLLSARLDAAESLKGPFSKPDFYWHFVLPTGAFLGELLRVHGRGEWRNSEGGGLELRIPVGSDFATTYPFDKVFKQVTVGDEGDIYAYLTSALRLEQAIEGLRENPDEGPGRRPGTG